MTQAEVVAERARTPTVVRCGPTPGATADALLAAAAELFAEQGVDVSLEEIARRACVGIGTLYRNFADP